MPPTKTVRIGGVTACDPDGCPLGDCTDWNDDWTLNRVVGSACNYTLDMDICGESYGSLKLLHYAIPGNKVRVEGRIWESDVLTAVWQKDIAADGSGQIDCESVGALTLISSVVCGPEEGQAFCQTLLQ